MAAPNVADYLLELALQRRYPAYELQPLDNRLEERAHVAAVQRALAR